MLLRENLIKKKKCELFFKHTSPALRGNLNAGKNFTPRHPPEVATSPREAKKENYSLPLGNLAKVFMMRS
jgi:hypothetical protein